MLGGGCWDLQPLSLDSELTLDEEFNPSKWFITCNQGTEWQHFWAQAGKESACAGQQLCWPLLLLLLDLRRLLFQP